MFTFGIKIILILLLIGGATSLIGDYIGRIIGRKRLTFFILRPRHTAYIITALTGILIVSMTTAIMLVISRDARTVLFGLEELQKELSEKSQLLANTKVELEKRIVERQTIDKELSEAKINLRLAAQEIADLEKTREKLKAEVKESRQGKVLFKVDEVLLISLIQAGRQKEELEQELKQTLSAADACVRSFGIENEKHLIFISPQDFESALLNLQKRQGESVIIVAVTRNTLFGEEVPVRFDISENKLIYRSGQEIAETLVPPSLSIPEIEQKIKELLSTANRAAREAGVLPDSSGSVGSVPYSTIFSLAKKLKSHAKSAQLKTLARTDIYSIGPLEVDFKIF